HATPWGAHVNEGAVEWPPSPWRLLRALMAVGFAKRGWTGGTPGIPALARSLLERLAGVMPHFRLPDGTVAHSRHYLPFTEGTAEKTTKVIDAFFRLSGDQPAHVHWPLVLPAEEGALLADLS